VPLEEKTVRFIDNFSQGTRGSASAEQFIKHSYAVLFLHRKYSFKPFERHLNSLNVLEMLSCANESDDSFKLDQSKLSTTRLKQLIKEYGEMKERNLLLNISFISLFDYFALLEFTCKEIDCMKENAIVYLAAAVSDFYLPRKEMPKHKIQSNQKQGLHLNLQPVPKLLGKLKSEWCPNAYIISFKLETDINLLNSKAMQSLEKYKHHVVIANLLEDRKNKVTIIQSNGSSKEIKLKEENHFEIEELIINFLIELHDNFILNS